MIYHASVCFPGFFCVAWYSKAVYVVILNSVCLLRSSTLSKMAGCNVKLFTFCWPYHSYFSIPNILTRFQQQQWQQVHMQHEECGMLIRIVVWYIEPFLFQLSCMNFKGSLWLLKIFAGHCLKKYLLPKNYITLTISHVSHSFYSNQRAVDVTCCHVSSKQHKIMT